MPVYETAALVSVTSITCRPVFSLIGFSHSAMQSLDALNVAPLSVIFALEPLSDDDSFECTVNLGARFSRVPLRGVSPCPSGARPSQLTLTGELL